MIKQIFSALIGLCFCNIGWADPNTDLLMACKKGELEELKLQISRGADPNYKSASGETALCTAFIFPELLEFLLTLPNTDVNLPDGSGQNLLLKSVYWNVLPAVKLLLTKERCNFSYTDNHGNNVFHMAASGHACLEIWQLLLAKNNGIKNANQDGFSPFTLYCMKGKSPTESTAIYRRNGVQYTDNPLFEKYARWWLQQSEASFTPVKQILDFFAGYGFDPHFKIMMDNHELLFAPIARHLQQTGMKEEMIRNISQKLRGKLGRDYTALSLACEYGAYDVARTLIMEYRMDVNEKDHFGKDAFICLLGQRDVEDSLAYEQLLQFMYLEKMRSNPRFSVDEYYAMQVNITPLFVAARSGNCFAIRFLLEKGANINKLSYAELSPLNIATEYRQSQAVELLLQNKAHEEIKKSETWKAPDLASWNNDYLLWSFYPQSNPAALARAKGYTEITALFKRYR